MKPTKQQQNTIDSPLGNILVSAGAGSGKTSVMTKRIVNRIVDKKVDIRQILVMTFTDAAAKSMRMKIQKALKTASAQCQEQRQKFYLRKQVKFLNQSNISTIHSFCLEVIKNFYYELSEDDQTDQIEPGFGIADPKEAQILLKLSAQEVFDKHYKANDEDMSSQECKDFMHFVNSFSGFKSDERAKEMLLSMYNFLVSMPDYETWLEREVLEIENIITNFDKTRWFDLAKRGLNLRLENARTSIEEIRLLLQGNPLLYKSDKNKQEDAIQDFGAFLDALDEIYKITNIENISWNEIYERCQNIPKCPDLRRNKSDSYEKSTIIDLLQSGVAELVFYLTGEMGTDKYSDLFDFGGVYMFSKSKESIQQEVMEMYPAIKILAKLLLELDTQYNASKRKEKTIDFKDFEHLALKLLNKESVKTYYKEKFKEIYIDEYQDTSSLQEQILRLISDENVFFVGDVKQSIYKFRHAKPSLFIEKYEAYHPFDGNAKKCGTVYELNKNFRSLDMVLRGVNNVFYQIMSKGAGEIEYNQDHALALHRQAAMEKDNLDYADNEFKINILMCETDDLPKEKMEEDNYEEIDDDSKNDNEEEINWNDFNNYEKEAKAVAIEIHKLIHHRGTNPGQIAILARTKNICEIFAKALDHMGVENESESANIFLLKYEQKVLESLLHILDNLKQDIPLASVMGSPIFEGGFSEEELFEIRIFAPLKFYFFECAQEYAKNGDNKELRAKVVRFYEYIEKLRMSLKYKPVSQIMQEVLEQSLLILYSAGQKDKFAGLKAMENFIDWVKNLEERRNVSLQYLISLIKEIKDKSGDDSPFGIEESVSDSVKVMTIHKSKGLEFENVFLVGNNRKLASLDAKSKIIYDQDNGITFSYVNFDKQYSLPTVPHILMREELKRSQMAEEMRLLYVAMTRAMDRLYISSTYSQKDVENGKGPIKILEKARALPANQKIPEYMVLSAKQSIDWILMSIARNPFCDFSKIGIGATSSINDKKLTDNMFYDDCWNIKIINMDEISREYHIKEDLEEEKIEESKTDESAQEGYLFDENKLKEKYFKSYSYEDATKTTLKTSVSEIKRRQFIENEEIIQGINTKLSEIEDIKDEVSPTFRGNVIHGFFRYLDLEKIMSDITTQNLLEHISQMENEGIFTKEETQILIGSKDKLIKYFESLIAKDIYEKEKSGEIVVYREMPFTLRVKPEQIFNVKTIAENDYSFVQGIIDLWYKNPRTNQGVLIDFKTDRIFGSKEQIKTQLTNLYEHQMRMYTKAIREIEKINIQKCIIWHFESAQPIEIKIAID